MNSTRIFGLVILVLGTATQALAGRTTGNELLHKCRQIESFMAGNSTEDMDAVRDATECMGYISATAETLEGVGFGLRKTNPELQFVCLPDTSTRWQIAQVALSYLKAHPEELHLQASLLLFSAFTKAFPCHPGKPATENPTK